MKRRDFLKTASAAAASAFLWRCGSKPENPPNILFAVADDASYPHMGAYGCDWVETPAFDRVAREGILFTRAYTPNAKCAPSRACILTGRNSWQLEEAANHWCYYPTKFKSYVETLADHGYFTGYTGKGWAPGIANDADGNPRHMTGTPYQQKTTEPPTNAMSKIDYAANFREFLNDRPEGQPFCFWYGGFEPHRRYEYGTGVKAGKRLEQIKNVFDFWPDNKAVRNDILDYAYEIDYFDQHLTDMLAALEKAGELENTIVVVTADNGMPFPRIKGQKYEYSNHLPLAIMWPKGIANPGRTIKDYVSFIDFAPTFLQAAGVDPQEGGMQPIQGRSLFDIFESPNQDLATADRNHVLIGKERHDIGRPNDVGYPIRGIVKGDYLYIRNFKTDRWPGGNPETGYLNCDGSPTKTEVLNTYDYQRNRYIWELSFGKRPEEELYYVAEDPECMNNLVEVAAFDKKRQELRELMETELKAQNDPRILGNGDIFDQYQYAHENGRNFHERYMEGDKSLNWGWVNDGDFRPEHGR